MLRSHWEGLHTDKKKIVDLSADILLKYYDNDIQPFLDHLNDNALWYGTAEGQHLQGKESIVADWSAENNPLTFTVNNLKLASASCGTAMCVVVMDYTVITHYPSGNDITIHQRLAFTWCQLRDQGSRRNIPPRGLLCDITNLHPKSDEDLI